MLQKLSSVRFINQSHDFIKFFILNILHRTDYSPPPFVQNFKNEIFFQTVVLNGEPYSRQLLQHFLLYSKFAYLDFLKGLLIFKRMLLLQ